MHLSWFQMISSTSRRRCSAAEMFFWVLKLGGTEHTHCRQRHGCTSKGLITIRNHLESREGGNPSLCTCNIASAGIHQRQKTICTAYQPNFSISTSTFLPSRTKAAQAFLTVRFKPSGPEATTPKVFSKPSAPSNEMTHSSIKP